MAAIACNSLHFSCGRGLVLHTVQQLCLSALINDVLLCASWDTNNMAPCYYAVLHCSFLINNDKVCYDVLQGHTSVQLKRGKLFNIHTLVLFLPLFFVLPCHLFWHHRHENACDDSALGVLIKNTGRVMTISGTVWKERWAGANVPLNNSWVMLRNKLCDIVASCHLTAMMVQKS